MGKCIEVFVANGRSVREVDAQVLRRAMPIPAVHRNPMSASYQST
jgi:hypothetical protein